MPPTSDVYELVLPKAGLSVLLAELTVSQMVNAMKAPGTAAARGAGGAGLAINAEALRMSIRQINGKNVSYVDLQGDELVRRLGRVRYFTALVGQMAKLYAPEMELLQEIKRKAKVSIRDFAEVWKVSLPDGRVVELEEVSLETLGAAINEAEAASKSVAAATLLGHVAAVRRSIRSIDGNPITESELDGKGWDVRFSVFETRILGFIYDAIHGDGEDFEVGEQRPASGTK